MNNMDANNQSPSSINKLRMSIDLRLVAGLLLAVIVVMLCIWKPWSAPPNGNERSIKVTGQATLSATPDEFVFYPTYDFKNSDQAAALTALSQKSDEIITKLKALGVPDNKIKSNADGYKNGLYSYRSTDDSTTYNLQLTITVGTKDLAQKVQDYIVTTSPTGTVSPAANFSDAKRKQLESQARDAATKEARSKAEQSGRNLGFKVGKVKSVTDGSGFGNILPFAGKAQAADSASPRLTVQPGENDLSYSVTVEYFLK
jgi:uncharacterized protein